MKKLLLLTATTFMVMINAYSQSASQEEELVKKTINDLFRGMRNGDSTLVSSAFSRKIIMQTIHKDKTGELKLTDENAGDFIRFTGTAHKEKFDERIVFTKVLIDGNLASVWTDYKFYIDDKLSHCGVNSFQLFKEKAGWKIIYLVDTRRKENCN